MMKLKQNIRHIGHHAMMSLLALSMFSCSEALTEPESSAANGDASSPAAEAYYLTLKVATPNQAGTRANGESTDEDGGSGAEVEGTAPETSIKSARIYFCNGSIVVADFAANYIDVQDGSSSTATIRVELTDDKLNQLESLVGKTANILVAANYNDGTTDLYSAPSGKGVDLAGSTFNLNGKPVRPLRSFGDTGQVLPLMSYDNFEVTIPAAQSGQSALDVIKALFSRHTATIAWWDVKDKDGKTQINLERGVARLEYKDKRPTDVSDPKLSRENIYKIDKLDNVYLELTDLMPFNVNTESYLFRHTAAGDQTKATEVAKIFGFENGYNSGENYNWIANPDWSLSGEDYTFSKRTLLNALTLSGSPDSYSFSKTDGRTEVGDITTQTSTDGYHPWCYVSENTVYSQDLMKFSELDEEGKLKDLVVAQYATGVAFRFKVLMPDGTPVTNESDITDVPEFSWSTETDKTGHLIITDLENGKWVEPKVVTNSDDGTKNYYLTYIACIVHNKPEGVNPDKDEYAPMYYGVVRNNTYQISIGKVDYLPLPQDPRTLYLQIQVKVLPWTVRNNEFIL